MIWIFGDSYSANFDHDRQGPFSLEYINYKGYIPKTFGGFLSDYLNCEHINLAIPGNNNDTIFEEVIKNAPIIRKGDIVIIGWSDIIRFRLAEHENEKTFISVLPRRNKPERLADVSVNTTDEILVNRMSSAYYEEFKIRFNFINWLFRDNILIQWTCHHCNISGKDECDVLNFTKPYLNTIILETDGLRHSLFRRGT
jgi:hypothetical protein